MGARFQELDWRTTRLGEISLRRRRDPASGEDVYEVKLDDDFLMSSMFTAGEVALAQLGLESAEGRELDVVVGGLGLGHTADAVLDDPRLRSLLVVEALPEVIGWHERGLVPLGPRLAGDDRCRLVPGDFFALALGADGFDAERPGRRFDAVLLDVDHAPDHVLHPSHAALYEPDGLRALAAKLRPGGVFALWSNDPPADAFLTALGEVFDRPRAHDVRFDNPLQGGTSANTVYVGHAPAN
ncbi:spermidine synthase [Streptomyces sp. HNM0574]|uniref:spermidine synthase n=1 Tax=Streptomyces sp. HNM0574 TaxID=2714954 RepID=UPI00146B1C14|nr:spermidine synthase [Streptomyces sp. HNM0574]NLU68409.1 spermidine synthase [Streptomyces sp. HNM0574]